MLTDVEKSCIWTACDEYKRMVSRPGPDATAGLLDKWSVSDFYNTVIDNEEEFKNDILNHPFFKDDCESLSDAYNKKHSLFIYCLQTFLSKKLLFGFVGITTTTDTTTEPIDTVKDEETENKKEFIKEVMEGVEKKKSLAEFFDDPRSYRQYRDDVDNCLLHMNWDKIHKVMKALKWKWFRWNDEFGDVHNNTVPSVYGIREFAIGMIKRMEDFITQHPEQTNYRSGCGGFEIEMWMCNEDDIDDYEHQVRFVLRFVAEQYDNGM